MTRCLQIQLLCVLLFAACSSGSNNNDASGTAGTSGSAGTTGSGGTTGSAGTTGTAGTGGSGGRGGTGTGGMNCLSATASGLMRGSPCPRDGGAPCYAQCDFDGIEYVGCISGDPNFTQCYSSCGSCPN
jgi:hypothetical protein